MASLADQQVLDQPVEGKARARDPRHASLRRALVPVLAILALSLAGSPYYLLPAAERVRHAWHPWLRPSGYVGQAAGIACFALFVFLWLYPLRKRVRWLAFTGAVGAWLDVHVVAGVLVPLLGAVHAAWNFQGLIGLGYASMAVVALSGLVGRYLYVRIPRHRGGVELSREEAATRRRELITRLSALTRMPPASIEAMLAPAPPSSGGLLATLTLLLRDDLARGRAVRDLVAKVREEGRGEIPPGSLAEIVALARREMALAQQVRILDRTGQVFRFWHLAHRPFAISAFLAVSVHVVVVGAVGATWFW